MVSLWPLKLVYVAHASCNLVLLRFINAYFAHRGFSPLQIGAIQGLRPVAAVLGEYCWAWAADWSKNFRTTVLCCNVLGVAIFLGLSCKSSFPVFMLLYGLANFCLSWMGVRDSIVLARLTEIDQAGAFGHVRKFAAFGWGSTGLLIGALNDRFGQGAMFCVYAAMESLLMLLVLFCVDAKAGKAAGSSTADTVGAQTGEGLGAALRSGWVALFFLNLLLYGFGMASVETYSFVYLVHGGFQHVSDTLLGSTVVASTLSELVVFQFAERILSWGLVPVFTASSAALALRCMLYSALPAAHPWLMLAIEPLHGVTFAAMWMVAVDFGRQNAPPGSHSRMQALITSTYIHVAMGFGTFIWGGVMHGVGFREGYSLCAIFVMVWNAVWIALMRCCVVRPGGTLDDLSKAMLPSA